jgi:hypothetical protein
LDFDQEACIELQPQDADGAHGPVIEVHAARGVAYVPDMMRPGGGGGSSTSVVASTAVDAVDGVVGDDASALCAIDSLETDVTPRTGSRRHATRSAIVQTNAKRRMQYQTLHARSTIPHDSSWGNAE